MAKLSKKTIQRLAVLQALSHWPRGAYGPVRVHKTLFFTDKKNPQRRLFTFKKHELGQYSQDIADALNALKSQGILECFFDGPAERLTVALSAKTKRRIRKLFANAFPEWKQALSRAFSEWGYLSNPAIINKAHADESYSKAERGQIIFTSNLPKTVDIPDMDDETAEALSDLVDEKLTESIREKLLRAVEVQAEGVDWRQIYFGRNGN